MKRKITKIVTCLAVIMAASSCELEVVNDPNFGSVGSVTNNASKIQLDALITGETAAMRNGLATYLEVVGTLGKELFNFNGTESRWMTELNGLRPIDNSAFYNGATTAFGVPIRQANIILAAVDNTSSVTDQQKQAYRGVANTFKGLAYLYMLNVQYTNGVRLDVTDPFNPSKPASYDESLTGIAGFLDEGATQLDAAGAVFPFTLPSGYAGFNTPADFKKFNRAIALRVAIYQKNWTKAAALLPQTFISETGSLTTGPVHTFSPSSPDIANPMLNTSSSTIVGLTEIWDDADYELDNRRNKVDSLDAVLTYTSGVTYSTPYRAKMYTSATNSVPIIRNEELILIAAEIEAQQNDATECVRLLNIVRNAAGLPNYGGATSQSALIDAILHERIYSLWFEGHRWVDMRRYDKLDEIETPAGMTVLVRLERPVAEVNWDTAHP